mgnify:CR=1 FL=1
MSLPMEFALFVGAGLTKLKAEEAGVAASLQLAAESLWPPLLDALSVEPGFEKEYR